MTKIKKFASHSDFFKKDKQKLTYLKEEEKEKIISDIKNYGFIYLEGLFELEKDECDNEIIKIYNELVKYIWKYSKLVLVRKQLDNIRYYYIGEVKKLVRSSIKVKELTIRYFLNDIEEGLNKDFDEKDFILLENDNAPELSNGEYLLELLPVILENVKKDLVVSRPRIIMNYPFLTEKESKLLKDYIFVEKNDLICLTSSQDTAIPTIHNWNPQSQQLSLWENYTKTFTEWKRLNGIKTNTRFKRAEIKEMEADFVEEQFISFENKRRRMLETNLNKIFLKWNLKYKIKQWTKD